MRPLRYLRIRLSAAERSGPLSGSLTSVIISSYLYSPARH
jgi:hypothetical protein